MVSLLPNVKIILSGRECKIVQVVGKAVQSSNIISQNCYT